MASKGSSKGQQGHYGAYSTENRHSTNKKRRMMRHLKAHPNDEQTRKVVKGEITYKRKSSKGSSGASKGELELNRKTTIGKRVVYDSKGFVIKHGVHSAISPVTSIREQMNNVGIYRGRDLRNKTS